MISPRVLLIRALRAIARRLEPRNVWEFLDAKQGELGGVEPVDLAALVTAYVAGHGECFFLQIGAHTGSDGDPLSEVVRALRLPGILVEPQAAQFEALLASCANQPQLILERAAIAADDGEAALYKVRPDFWEAHGFPAGLASQVSSLDREQVGRVVEIFGGGALRRAEEAWLEIERVPALTFGSLLAKHGVTSFDLLQIDTEGFDFEVLKMVDWQRHRPALVNYETVNLSVEDRIAAWALLRGLGYSLYASNIYNTVAVRMSDLGRS